jgi:diguanylate cyclase (GGDEF)-like protein/PAS domain S-box-containing protein
MAARAFGAGGEIEMASEPKRADESESLAALWALDVLDSAPESVFDALVKIASEVCGTPVSLLSLIDADRQWFKANVGLPGVTQTPRAAAFCAHAVLGDDILEVADAKLDVRFHDNPLVIGEPDIRFYAGAPVTLSSGYRVGTLCVLDRVPRRLTGTQRTILCQLAVAAANALEGRNALIHASENTRALHEAQRLGQIGSWEWDVELDSSIWSAQMYLLFGLDPANRVPTFNERAKSYSPESWERMREAVERSVQYREPFELELRFFRGDGTLGWMDARGEAVTDATGKVVRLHGTAQDITDRKQAERELRKSREFLERTGTLAGVGGWEVDLDTGAILWSDEVCKIHGVEPGYRPTMEEAIAFYAPVSRSVVEEAVKFTIESGHPFDFELELIRRDGRTRWVRSVGAVELVDGRAVRLSGAFQDVTERHVLALDLARQHELLRVTLQSIGDAVITTDAKERVTWLNPVAERMTGWLASEALGRQLAQVFNIVHEDTRQSAEIPAKVCIRENKIAGLPEKTILISRDGREYGVEDSASPILSEHADLLGVVLVFHDVTEQRRMSGEMTYRATHDALTGLVNRTEFEARLQRTLRKAKEQRSQHALMYIDLDQFKLVNDACGHSAGDQLLKQVSKLLLETIRARDTLARLGGDEFAVILDHCPSEKAWRVAEQICEKMNEFRFVHDEKRFRIGASIGLVPVDDRWPSTLALMQAADTSCYAAKEAGRNRVHAWFDTDQAMQARHGEMQWASRLEQALDEDRFVLFAQRIFPVDERPQGLHAEVLLRLREATGSLVLPGAFLPAAERFHLASRVDRWVLRRVIDLLMAQPSLHGIELLSVNLSGQSIGDRAFHRQATDILGAAGPEICGRICLEITETAAITNMVDASLFIQQARALGVRIALDDFGAGASSFGYLKSLSVDILKIDGQFIRDLTVDPLDDAAVRCFVDVAKVVNVKTVAEFVDKPEILERLREMGVDYAQGYLLNRPEPIANFLALATSPLVVDS